MIIMRRHWTAYMPLCYNVGNKKRYSLRCASVPHRCNKLFNLDGNFLSDFPSDLTSCRPNHGTECNKSANTSLGRNNRTKNHNRRSWNFGT